MNADRITNASAKFCCGLCHRTQREAAQDGCEQAGCLYYRVTPDGELEAWRSTADELLRGMVSMVTQRRGAHLLQNAYLFATALRSVSTPAVRDAAVPVAAQEPTLSVKRSEWRTLSPEVQAKLEKITGAEHPDTKRARAQAAEDGRNVVLCGAAQEPQPDASPLGRDADWVLAMGYALGLDSGFKVPIVPTVGAFKALFDSVRAQAQEPAQPVAWIAFADRAPPEDAAIDNPSVKSWRSVLVTNNLNARDRMGRMSHVWYASPIHSALGSWVTYDEADRKIVGLTHWFDPLAASPDVVLDALEKARAFMSTYDIRTGESDLALFFDAQHAVAAAIAASGAAPVKGDQQPVMGDPAVPPVEAPAARSADKGSLPASGDE